MTYQELDQKLQGRNRERRKLANNTYAERRLASIAIKLHATDVLSFRSNGEIEVNTGGWKTSTTKERINAFLPFGLWIQQKNGIWFWKTGQAFSDGDLVLRDGTLQTKATAETQKEERTLRRRILAFAKLCASKLPLDKPGPGDCFYCQMKTETGQSLGDAFKYTGHLFSHMEEGYCVPSLVYRAMNEAGCGAMVISWAFNPGAPDFAKRYVAKSVRRYMFRRLGLAA